jgi:hypothetical protein
VRNHVLGKAQIGVIGNQFVIDFRCGLPIPSPAARSISTLLNQLDSAGRSVSHSSQEELAGMGGSWRRQCPTGGIHEIYDEEQVQDEGNQDQPKRKPANSRAI